MRVASRMRPERRLATAIPRYVLWDHDGENVTGFVLDVDGTEHDLGALSPISGTTYRADLTPLGYANGEYDITIIAYNGDIRADAAAVTLTW